MADNGRSRFPFGLKVSSEIFHRKLNEALSDLKGVICVADDLVDYGSGKSPEEANYDHAQKLLELQRRCMDRNIKLNDEKSAFKETEITFMGHRITNEGVRGVLTSTPMAETSSYRMITSH